MIPHSAASIPAAILRQEHDLPWVQFAPGVSIQLLQVDFDHNLRVTRARLDPGVRFRTHTHTGHVFAWTVSGAWKYVEYDRSSDANSYLYEPAGSTHTLTVADDADEPADVVFIVHGSNIELGPTGEIEGATDAAQVARAYLRGVEELGLPRPDIIGMPDGWT